MPPIWPKFWLVWFWPAVWPCGRFGVWPDSRPPCSDGGLPRKDDSMRLRGSWVYVCVCVCLCMCVCVCAGTLLCYESKMLRCCEWMGACMLARSTTIHTCTGRERNSSIKRKKTGSKDTVYVSIHVCMYVCMHACTYVCTYVCNCACMNECIHGCIYVCMFGTLHPKHLTCTSQLRFITKHSIAKLTHKKNWAAYSVGSIVLSSRCGYGCKIQRQPLRNRMNLRGTLRLCVYMYVCMYVCVCP